MSLGIWSFEGLQRKDICRPKVKVVCELNLSGLLTKYALKPCWPSSTANEQMSLGQGTPQFVNGTVQCQDVNGNVENNVNKGDFKGARRCLRGSLFSRLITSVHSGIIQTGFARQINQSWALWLWAVCVTPQFLLPWNGDNTGTQFMEL